MTCRSLRYWAPLLRQLLLGFSVSNLRPTSHQLWLSSKGMLDLPLSLSPSLSLSLLAHVQIVFILICTNQNTISKPLAYSDTLRPSISVFTIFMLCKSMDVASLRHLQQRPHGLCTWKTTKTSLLPTASSPRLFGTFRKCLSNVSQNWGRHTNLSPLPFSRYAKIPNAQRTLVHTETLHATASFQGGNDSTDYRTFIQQQNVLLVAVLPGLPSHPVSSTEILKIPFNWTAVRRCHDETGECRFSSTHS